MPTRDSNLLRALYDTAIDPIVVAGIDRRVLKVNQAFTEEFGYSAEEVCGELTQMLYDDPDDFDVTGAERFNLDATVERHQKRVVFRRKDGSSFPARLLGNPVLDDSGAVIGYLGIIQDLSVSEARELDLASAVDRAEAAGLAKAAFLAQMSHEIRTPMSGVIGMLELIARRVHDDEIRRFADLAHGSARALLAVLNDLLDMSKLDAGKISLETMPFSPEAEIGRALALFSVRAAEKGVTLKSDVPETVPQDFQGDPLRVGQVLNNLISNAVKFTLQGTVTVSARRTVEDGMPHLLVMVRDTGIGIAEDRQAVIFDEFTQANVSTAREYGGTGLGLSISRRLVRLMGGRIGVESVPGRGSVFWFAVPDAAAAEARTFDKGTAASADLAPLAEDGTPLDVLVVDDNIVNQKIAEALLEEAGHRVSLADDGLGAIKLAGAGRFDVVLMDLEMPRMDGLEATARLLDLPTFDEGTPIIGVTAHDDPKTLERCIRAGMAGTLPKPLDGATLRQKIDDVTGAFRNGGATKQQVA